MTQRAQEKQLFVEALNFAALVEQTKGMDYAWITDESPLPTSSNAPHIIINNRDCTNSQSINYRAPHTQRRNEEKGQTLKDGDGKLLGVAVQIERDTPGRKRRSTETEKKWLVFLLMKMSD